MALPGDRRLHEEDPFTGEWTAVGDSSVVVDRSRFEVDLNRSREDAVYLEAGQCWGLKIWTRPPPESLVEASRALHDRFYGELYDLLSKVERAWGRFVVVDLHSYNHRREGTDGPPADQAGNPDVNVGTGSVDRDRWGRLIDRFVDDLRSVPMDTIGATEPGPGRSGRGLDVRENVRFQGAHLVQWVNATFPGSGCALAVEVKKIFMDEHTGRLDDQAWKEVQRALETAAAGCRQEVRR